MLNKILVICFLIFITELNKLIEPNELENLPLIPSFFQILYFEGNQVFQAVVMVFNDATQGAGYLDMKAVDTSATVRTGCMKVVFINKFVQDLLVSCWSCREILLHLRNVHSTVAFVLK